MATDVLLTPELERFAEVCVQSGRYDSVSDVVRSALRLLQQREDERRAFVASLEMATEESRRNGFVPADAVAAEIRAAIAAVARER